MLNAHKRRRSTPNPDTLLVGLTDAKVGPFGAWCEPSECRKSYIGTFGSEDTVIGITNPGPPYRTGGGVNIFHYLNSVADMQGTSTYLSQPSLVVEPGVIVYRYRGGFVPNAGMGDVLTGITQGDMSSEANIPFSAYPTYACSNAQGATGWNRFRPGRPVADVGVFVGEFKDIPRMLKTTAKGFHDIWRQMGGAKTHFGPKSVAKHWLNTQFGWLPFVNDLRKFQRAYARRDAYFRKLRRDNGRWVRRSGTVSTLTDSVLVHSHATVTGHWPVLVTALYASSSSSGSYKVTRVTTDHTWFEAAFRYWIPQIESVQWEARALAGLYGALPSPSLIWELTPWSWLVDWHSNLGDVISNLSTNALDNLAAKYAYVMRTRELSADMESFHALKYTQLHNNWRFSLTWKSRQVASPFGFGLTDNDLTVRQWSILSALGITRLH